MTEVVVVSPSLLICTAVEALTTAPEPYPIKTTFVRPRSERISEPTRPWLRTAYLKAAPLGLSEYPLPTISRATTLIVAYVVVPPLLSRRYGVTNSHVSRTPPNLCSIRNVTCLLLSELLLPSLLLVVVAECMGSLPLSV